MADSNEIRLISDTLAVGVYYGSALRCLLHTSPEALEAARNLVAAIVDDYPAECLARVNRNCSEDCGPNPHQQTGFDNA